MPAASAPPPDPAAPGPGPGALAVSLGVHKARPLLTQLIRDAEQGTITELTRGEGERALLVSAHLATTAGVPTADAPTFGIAEARPVLGDLVAHAAAGTPQVLLRHKRPVAVLARAAALFPTTAAVPSAAAVPSTATETPAVPPAAVTAQDPAAEPTPTAPVAGPSAAAAVPAAVSSTSNETPFASPQAAAAAPRTAAGPSAAAAAPALEHAAVPAAATAARPVPRRRLAPLGEALDTLLPATAAAVGDGEQTQPVGLPTGIPTLDQALGCLQPGRFYLVAGAPGTGASLLAISAARATALTQHRTVLYAASGLTRADIAARVIAAHTPVDYRRLRAQTLDDTERQAVARTAELLAAAPLLIDDGTGLDAEAITTTAADVPDLALVVVDRLQTAPDPRLPLSGTPALADAGQALAHLARTHDLPVLAALDTDNPDLIHALAADVTLTLTPDRAPTTFGTGGGRVRLVVAERDLGRLATLTLAADPAHARLTDPTPDHEAAPGASSATPAAASGAPAAPSAGPAASSQQAHPDPAAPAVPATGPAQAPEAPQTPNTTTEGPPEPATPLPDTTLAAEAAKAAHSPSHAPAVQSPAADVPATFETGNQPLRPARSGSARAAAARGAGYADRDYSYYLDMISSAVDQALEEHGGDTEAAIAALENKAIPNGMELFDATRVGATYEHTVYPETLDLLRKKSRNGADDIWEGRHKWENVVLLDDLRKGKLPLITVDVLDTNAAYCTALKTHLPIGALQHQPDGGFDPKRSGIYLLPKRPIWQHPHLPDPIGNRRESGPVLLDDATVRLLIRCHKLGLADAPHITEAWTSGASESLLEKYRRVLTLARENAITTADTVTEAYVKAIYAKFVSTIGESTHNRDLRRPDWMHIIRSQAFANLWYKAHRAHTHGLTIVALRGTDELHTTSDSTDWRTVFTEGRLTTQMKLKDQYTLPRTRKAA
ncbi:DnaB-like helicase C-terminal domain-containing protein [Kitasatospora sp. NPDC057541]|uniref:DnaB-like helicase C-terminal domain-containing protein n=1 Tax=unclassified Kitasatospora TaxID=2633591 RepID=UPI00369392C8